MLGSLGEHKKATSTSSHPNFSVGIMVEPLSVVLLGVAISYS